MRVYTAELLAAMKPGAEIEVDAYVAPVGPRLLYLGWLPKASDRNPSRLGILVDDIPDNRHDGDFVVTIVSPAGITPLPPDSGLLGKAVVPVYHLDQQSFSIRMPSQPLTEKEDQK